MANKTEFVHRYIEKYYEQKEEKTRFDTDNVLTVSAVVSEATLYCASDHKGKLHQHFYINIKQVTQGNKNLIDNNLVFVAAHYGDEDGIAAPIPHLQPGSPIIVRGRYIPSSEAFQTEDNPGFPVLHYTHHPIGYIIYAGVKYE